MATDFVSRCFFFLVLFAHFLSWTCWGSWWTARSHVSHIRLLE
jgi:hypothetical protein